MIEKVTQNYLKKSGFEIPYTLILNETLDAIPCNSALGIYLYLARKPQDWDIQEQDIMNRFGKGRDHVRKCLKILKKIGLYKKVAVRNQDGTVKCWESTLYAQITENPTSGFNQITEKPTCSKTQSLDNPTHTNKRDIQIKEKETNERINKNNARANNEAKKELKPVEYKETYYPVTQQHLDEHDEACESFKEFWNLYPIKKAENRARTAWYAQRCYKIKNDILQKLMEQIAKDRQFLDGFAPNPDKYLHEERWKDEITPPKKRGNALDLNDTSWASEFHKDIF
jgi:hypothetical protein